MITHDTVFDKVDRIYVMNDGHLVEKNTSIIKRVDGTG